ncbi:hypothetical protein GGR57DRAFT_460822 [Xylariaceae sp. FL1272]|nr:hypothetical protein GGR57DRAFT_460822 [Xylariaceae sp. FL1272]
MNTNPNSKALDMAQELLRSVMRTFYGPPNSDTRLILIIDALCFHSALRDDDLGLLMNMNLKDLHKLCGKLREERFLQVHTRPELKTGQQRPTNRTYYYIDYRKAIDVIKWRTYQLDKAVQGDAKPAAEKKEYFCRRCQAEWTTMEVLDKADPAKGFLCHRCDSVLIFDPERDAGGHEKSKKLNNQLRFITELLPKLDSVVIPDIDFDTAMAAHRDVIRPDTNLAAESIVVESISKPTAVKGMANTGPQSIAISITDSDGPTDAEKEAEKERKEKIAAANALPSWHTQSTVSGQSYSTKDAATNGTKEEDGDAKVADLAEDGMQNQDISNLFEMLAAQQAEDRRKEAEAKDSEDEEEEYDEDEEFEDIAAGGVGSGVGTGEKRASSATTSLADTPKSEDRPAKKVKVEEPADEDSDEEDVAFEDV